ncbi:MAG TPA: amino acid permease [Mycobacteriales bacterium]|nr:amino acid permease [Mycobacteriales bacterium]
MASPEEGELGGDRSTLTTGRVVFLVIAAAAPMAAMVGNLPLALRYGNGKGLPAAFLIAAVILLCFSVGYAAMSRRVVNTGAFYTYVARGLGKPPAVGAAYIAVLSYTALTIGLAGSFGYFVTLVIGNGTAKGPWEVPAAIAIGIVAWLGYRSVDFSAKVLGVLMILEFAILIVFDLGVLAHKGASALPASSFAPHNVFHGSLGVSLMIAFTSFVGFESAALYGEETKDPARSVPRATYIAVASIGVFYLLTSWFTVGSGGVAHSYELANKDLGNLLFDQTETYVDKAVSDLMAVLLCTSVLASMLAVHNASSRYLFALGRERILPATLGRYHPNHLSPHVGSATISVITTAVIAAFALGGLDPYLTLATSMVGLSSLGVILLQALAAASVVAFFVKRREGDVWRTVVAPTIGAIGLVAALVLALLHYTTLTNTTNVAIHLVPLLLVVAAVGGVVAGRWLERHRPAIYAGIARSRMRARPRTVPKVTRYDGRYCLVGAGPAGLITARALLAEGVPFDWYERNPDVGGIWDIEHEGSPMYASAHFISSRFVSGFAGYPMPADYPDYPTWEQVRDYTRAFARDHGLYDHVTLNTSVRSAVPVGDGSWDVRVGRVGGAARKATRYAGVIAAPGVTWHARRPEWPGIKQFRGEIRHSNTYVAPEELKGKRVLVVGAGNSGVDIACDAARSADAAFLSVRRGYRFIPKHIAGVPTDALITGTLMPPRGVAIPADPGRLVDMLVGDLTRFGLPKPDHALLETHPIMNTQVLHHFAHGDLRAKPDVAELTRDGVVFTDGSTEKIDLILTATGYDYRLPFLSEDLLTWRQGRPDLYLNIFSREHDGLSVIGFIEFASAAYSRFDEMAQLAVLDIVAHASGGELLRTWRELKQHDRPDLRGGHQYVDSPRHAAYVDAETYDAYVTDLRDRLGWGDLPLDAYAALRVRP